MTDPRSRRERPFGTPGETPSPVEQAVIQRGTGRGDPPEPPAGLVRSLAIPPWDVAKPPTAQDFFNFTQNMLVLPAGVGSTVSTTEATGGFVELPRKNIGKLETVVFSISNPLITDQWRFTVFMNGGGIPGLTNVGFQPVNGSYFALPISSSWQIVEGARLHVTFTNVDGAAKLVGVTLSGYYVPEADVYRYTGQRRQSISSPEEALAARRFLTR